LKSIDNSCVSDSVAVLVEILQYRYFLADCT